MSGYAISPFPTMNDLLAPQELRVRQAQQEDYHQNALLTNQHNQQVIDATDVEMTSRFAQTLTGLSEEEAARAYGPGIAYLQSQGFAKRAPPVFPGLEVTKRLADMGVSATEQYKTRQDAAGLATVAGAYGFNPPGSGATGQARLLPGETEDQFLARIEARESGGRNVMNYRNKEDPSKFTAGGYYQITDSTWKAGAQAAGIDISQYPTAISAPREVQTAVAKSILRNFGPQHWNQSEPGATQQANAAPRAPGSGVAPPPGVQMGGAPPGPPGGAPGPYSGGGFGTALNPTAPAAPVATTPPAPGGGTASNVPGLVNAIEAGRMRAQTTPASGAMVAGPGAPTEQRQVSSVEPPPQPGWGTAVGSYGDGAAAPVAPPGATQPPATTTPPPPPPAAAMPPELQTDNHGLTVRDRAELGGLLRAGRISPLAFQNEVQQRQNANVQRQNHWETQQTAQQNAAATAAQREVENKRQADAAAALAEQRRLENDRAGVPAGMQRNAEGRLEPMPGYRGATAEERINYALKNDPPDSQEYTDAWRAKKWQTAPNGSVIETDMSEYPPPTRSVRRPTFLPQPTGTALDEVRKADTDARVIVPSIDRYVDLHKKIGGSSWGAYFDDPKNAKAQQLIGAFNAMKTVLRSPTYANTGVLQPAEMEMLKQELVSPQTIRGLYASPQALEARLHEIKLAILSRQDAELRSVGRDGVIVRSEADLANVPDGGKFYDEDGNLRVKTKAEK